MSANPLHLLRKIILEDDRKKIEDLEQIVQKLQTQLVDKNIDKETLIEGLAPVIGDVLQKSLIDSTDEMIEVFAPIIAPAMRKQIMETQHEIIDALYPIIGKTIRKSVAESMKQLIDTVNRRIDATLRGGMFLKRIQARLMGVSDAELALKDALPFRIDQIFLIHKSSGLLIAQVSASEQEHTVDEELISGMLTAIKDFVTQAFKASNQDLNQIQYGDDTIILEEASHFYLAFVVSGPIPPNFSEKSQKLAERIHSIFHKKLRDFNGDAAELTGVQRLLTGSMREQEEKNAKTEVKPSKPYILYVMLFLGLPILLFFAGKKAYHHFNDQKIQQLVSTRLENDADLATVAPEIDLKIHQGQVILNGDIPSPRISARFDSVLREEPRVKNIINHLRYVRPSEKILQDIGRKLIRFRDVAELSPKFVIEKDHVFIEGTAPNSDVKREIGFVVREVEGVNFVINNMALSDDEFRILQQRFDRKIIPFEFNEAQLTEQQLAMLDSIPDLMQKFTGYVLYVRGFTDDQGTLDYNRILSEKRAKIVADYLNSKQIPASNLLVEGLGAFYPVGPNDTEENRRQNRRVTFELQRRR